VAAANQQSHPIALAILGMGNDGHTASLFPHARQLPDALDRRQPSRYAHITPPAAKYERISMTLAAMLQTGELILGIAGNEKKGVYERAARQLDATLPISYLIHQTETPFDVYWHP
jgi:6-phosphogluconolactonase